MSLNALQQGTYHLHETRDRERKLLVLENANFDWIEGREQDTLHVSKQRPLANTLIGEGQYILLKAKNEPDLDEQAEYLGLSDGPGNYYLYRLDEGLPTDRMSEKPLVPIPRQLQESEISQKAGNRP